MTVLDISMITQLGNPHLSQAVPSRTTWRRPLGAANLKAKRFRARVGWFSPSLLRFLSPTNGGTEGGVKTIEGRFSKKLLLAKGRQRVSKVHTLQSPHNIPTVSKMQSPYSP